MRVEADLWEGLAILLTLTAAMAGGYGVCSWLRKKAGVEPCGHFTKLFYDGYTGGLDSRITSRRPVADGRPDGLFLGASTGRAGLAAGPHGPFHRQHRVPTPEASAAP